MSSGPRASAPRLIIGCGNLDRGDDAAGLLAARRLRALGVAAGREVREAPRDPLALLDLWVGAPAVILIDAVVIDAGAPGRITTWDVRAAPLPPELQPCSTHAFGVAQTVELARALDRLPPRLILYAIAGRNFALGAQPSPEVLAAVEEVAQTIRRDGD